MLVGCHLSPAVSLRNHEELKSAFTSKFTNINQSQNTGEDENSLLNGALVLLLVLIKVSSHRDN